MGSLWATKKDNDDELGQNGANGHEESNDDMPVASSRYSGEADERTRLLPHQPPPPAEGFLSPDDPAVSFMLSSSTKRLQSPRLTFQ
jgi:hypothetical protein